MLIGSERSELAIPEELPYYRFPLLTLHVLSYCFQVISFHYAAELETLRTRRGLVDSTGPFTLSSADSQTHARICGAKQTRKVLFFTPSASLVETICWNGEMTTAELRG